LSGCYKTDQHEKGIQTLHAAWRAGFLLVDTAPGYDAAELLLAEAIQRWRGDRPIVATKTKQFTWELPAVVAHVHTSRNRLGRIDLLAVHDPQPTYSDEARKAITGFITDLLSEGVIAAAGLGGGGPVVQARWLEGGVFKYVITFNRLGAVTLQALTDTVPQARRFGASVFAASPLFMGLVGHFHEAYVADRPFYLPPVFITRAQRVRELADEWGLPLSHLAIRFLLSMPAVDVVVTGPSSPQDWSDCQAAYEAGPLPVELYAKVWHIAQTGPEPVTGG